MSLLFGEFELDRERRQLLREGRPVPLEPKAYELLSLLLERRPRALSRAQIRDAVWPGVFISESTLNQAVNNIRQALDDDAREPRYVRTAHRFGYAFCGEAREAADGRPRREGEGAREPGSSPYPGLTAFTEADAGTFYGREVEVAALWEKIRRQKLRALIGPSGVGKTSFLRAAVLPDRPEGWVAAYLTPGSSPVSSLAHALVPGLAGDAAAIQELLRGFEELSLGGESDRALAALRRWRETASGAIVAVDQLEELFTLCSPEVQGRFAALLGRLPEADIHVLLSLRDDFLFRCSEHEALRPVFQDLTPLRTPSVEALRRALVAPARSRGVAFEDGALVEEMLEAVEGERGALPLLAFAVSRLWDERDRETRLLTREAYERIGGVEGALAHHAEATLSRLGPAHEVVVREIFRNLVTSEGTRSARERGELLSVFGDRSDEAGAVLDTLVDARLLTGYESPDLDRSGVFSAEADPKAGTPAAASPRRIEIVHESLLLAWPRLVRWQAQDQEGAVLRDQLRQAARLWDEKGRPDDLLWTGRTYREYALWREGYPGGLTAAEESFGRAMTARARRARRRQRIAALTLLVVVTGVAGVFAALWRTSEDARRTAENEARRREAAQILSLGAPHLDGNPTAALAYAIASLERSDDEPARRFAVEALWRGPLAFQVNDDTNPTSPAWSPDGRWLALGGTAGLILYDRDGGQRRELHSGWAVPEGFSSDSSRLMAITRPGAGHLWSLPDATPLETWALPGAGGPGAFGIFIDRWLVSVRPEEGEGGSGSVVVRERSIDGGAERIVARWPEERFPDLSLEPEGRLRLTRRKLTSIENGRLLQRRLDEPQSPPRVLGRHDGETSVWAWPGTEKLATGDAGGEIRLWDSASGRLERSLRSPAGARALALDPSGRYVAAAPFGPLPSRSLQVFDLEAPRGAEPWALLNDEIRNLNGMSFHPEGLVLASGHYPQGVFLWNLTTPRSIVLRGQDGPNVSIAFAPDGRLVSMAAAGDVRVWPLWTSRESEPLLLRPPGRGHQELNPRDLEISADGRLAVVNEGFRTFRLLPLDGSPGSAHPGPGGGEITSPVKLSPDGRRLAFGTVARGRPEAASIRILDLATGERRTLRTEPTAEACVQNSAELGPAQFPVWLPDGRFVTEGALGLRLWDLDDGSSRRVRACRASRAEPPLLLATPDSSAVLTLFDPVPAPGHPSTLLITELATGAAREITEHGPWVSAFALDPTGTALVTGDMNGVVRVGALSGGEPHLLLGHSRGVTGVAVSPDGRWIASASDDDTIRLWPMPDLTRRPLHTLPLDELLEKLRSLTNVRVVPDPGSATGYALETAPFPGWKDLPTW